jgi:hypothetical protein
VKEKRSFYSPRKQNYFFTVTIFLTISDLLGTVRTSLKQRTDLLEKRTLPHIEIIQLPTSNLKEMYVFLSKPFST